MEIKKEKKRWKAHYPVGFKPTISGYLRHVVNCCETVPNFRFHIIVAGIPVDEAMIKFLLTSGKPVVGSNPSGYVRRFPYLLGKNLQSAKPCNIFRGNFLNID